MKELVRPDDAWLLGHMAEFDGRWTRGKPARRRVGVVVHHTGSNRRSDSKSNAYSYVDTHAIKPPYNILVGRDAMVYALTDEGIRANHAGRGSLRTLNAMRARRPVAAASVRGAAFCNSSTWGVAIDNDGLHEPVSDAVYMSLMCVCAALCLNDDLDPCTQNIGHREWTTRKVDPTFSLAQLRLDVHESLHARRLVQPWRHYLRIGMPNARPPKPPPRHLVARGAPMLRRGSRSQAVRLLQQQLAAVAEPGLAVDGIFGGGTQRAVRRFQRQAGLVPDGIVGPLTWSALAAALPM